MFELVQFSFSFRSDTAALNASEAAAIVASSRVTNLSMSWIDKVRELRPGLNKKMNLESKEQHEIEGEPPLPRLADNAVNSSDSSDSESRKPRVTTKLTAVDWAKSLFGESAGVQKAIAETEGGHKVSDALKQLRQRPLNLEMIPNVLLNFEPFWRTESLEKVSVFGSSLLYNVGYFRLKLHGR